jgi:hypothetical protein
MPPEVPESCYLLCWPRVAVFMDDVEEPRSTRPLLSLLLGGLEVS